jgi:hypothetical protein
VISPLLDAQLAGMTSANGSALGVSQFTPQHGMRGHARLDGDRLLSEPTDPFAVENPAPNVETFDGALDRFVAIRDADDVLRFARRFGVLNLCEHGLPHGIDHGCGNTLGSTAECTRTSSSSMCQRRMDQDGLSERNGLGAAGTISFATSLSKVGSPSPNLPLQRSPLRQFTDQPDASRKVGRLCGARCVRMPTRKPIRGSMNNRPSPENKRGDW